MRGPIVYCLEGADVAGGKVLDLVLPDDAPLATDFRQDLLGGVQVVTGEAQLLAPTTNGEAPAIKSAAFTAIPYYAWAHRGKGEMIVWLARTVDVVSQSDDRKKQE